ncbi:MAG: hypothetical protein OHK0029_13390 [Armatimonadaceae bacterium]
MVRLDFESVQPLLAGEQVRVETLVCTFRCPVTGFVVQGRGRVPSWAAQELQVMPYSGGAPEPTDRSRRTVHFLDAARTALFRTLRQMPRTEVPEQAVPGQAVPGLAWSPAALAERQRAVVEAFRQVKHLFQWDEETERWRAADSAPARSEATADSHTSPSLSGDFVRQMHYAPVTQPGQRRMLVRILMEVATADGRLDGDEKAFLGEFVAGGAAAAEELRNQPALTPEELSELTGTHTAETVVMLAWGMALTDEDLTGSEQERLTQLAANLRIADERAAELKRYAQFFLLEALLENEASEITVASGEELRRQVQAMAERIGLSPDEIPSNL